MPKEYLKLLGKLNVVTSEAHIEEYYVSTISTRERASDRFFIHRRIDYKSQDPMSGRGFNLIYNFYYNNCATPMSYVCH